MSYVVAISLLCDAHYKRPCSPSVLALGFEPNDTAWQCDERFEECVDTLKDVRRLASSAGWCVLPFKGRNLDLCPVCAYALNLRGPIHFLASQAENERDNDAATSRRGSILLPSYDAAGIRTLVEPPAYTPNGDPS